MATDNDLNGLLADLKRQRADLDKRIADVEARTESAADLVDRLQKLRERTARTASKPVGPDDDTLRMR
jgi:uncharacterized protein YlxW (UPF0749 family)